MSLRLLKLRIISEPNLKLHGKTRSHNKTRRHNKIQHWTIVEIRYFITRKIQSFFALLSSFESLGTLKIL